ncbi:unnamed protein product, partial [Ectocarpus sp. 12 AP-2014]
VLVVSGSILGEGERTLPAYGNIADTELHCSSRHAFVPQV